METSEPSSSSDPLAAAAADDDYPRWVMFIDAERGCWEVEENPCPISTDPKTVAHARTFTGHLVRASFCLAAPPAVSLLNLDLDDGLSDRVEIYHNVVAAHGDSVLVRMSMKNTKVYGDYTIDYFVYRAGDGTDQTPSLSLLPTCYIEENRTADFWLTRKGTVILRLGDGEFVVATNLKIDIKDDGGVKRAEAEFYQLRSSELQWKTQRLAVQGEVSFPWWVTDKVIPVADRFFYWVDLHEGIVFSDVYEESPELRFVPLPVDPLRRLRNDGGAADPSRNLCATDGGATVKYVLLCPRCCCGGPGVNLCALSCHAFTVTTWTLRSTQAGGMGSEKDCVVDSGELRALDTYRCLPLLPMGFSVVSIDDPDVVCFRVSEHWHEARCVVMIDMRIKSFVGSAPMATTAPFAEIFLPSQVSSYFYTSPDSGNQASPASERRRNKDTALPRAVDTGVTEVPLATDCVVSRDQVILASLQEIPGLSRDEMLRAYSVLACDDRRRYQTLLAVPMDMRKDYCCMLVDMGKNKQTQ
ncbi:unnamed protein product [Alopecurus aequalis]